MAENLSARARLRFGNVIGFAVIWIVLTGAQSVFATTQKAEGNVAPANIDFLKYVVSQNPEDVEAWAKLADAGLGVTATSRNWATVTALADMAASR